MRRDIMSRVDFYEVNFSELRVLLKSAGFFNVICGTHKLKG